MAKTEWIDLPDLTDYKGPIDKLIALLVKYRKQYGSKAVVMVSKVQSYKVHTKIQVEQRVKPEKKNESVRD